MGWEFRRSLRLGPFRVTLSRHGFSYSAGAKGARVTKRADGKVQRTLSIRGTGLSYRTISGKRRRRGLTARHPPLQPPAAGGLHLLQ